MLSDHSSIGMLEIVAEGIGRISGMDAVFVGGAVICLYIDDESMGQVRATKDVDCTVEMSSFIKYSKMEEKLREFGFRNVIGENTPLCRWSYRDVLVDIMPDDENIIGFTNSWYRTGRENRISAILPSGRKIDIFPLEYFLASKIEAFEKRGKEDFLGSKDIEDVIAVLDGITDLNNILLHKNHAAESVKTALRNFAINQDFVQSLTGHIESGDAERARRILHFLQSL